MVCSILNGIQLTLKDMQIDNFMKYGYNYTIRRKDFKEVVEKRISYIDSLRHKHFEKNTSGKSKRFRMEKSLRID